MRKLAWYAQRGVPEVWIVDPQARILERLVLQDDGHYLIAESLTGPGPFRPAGWDGFELPLEELWSAVDEDE